MTRIRFTTLTILLAALALSACGPEVLPVALPGGQPAPGLEQAFAPAAAPEQALHLDAAEADTAATTIQPAAFAPVEFAEGAAPAALSITGAPDMCATVTALPRSARPC